VLYRAATQYLPTSAAIVTNRSRPGAAIRRCQSAFIGVVQAVDMTGKPGLGPLTRRFVPGHKAWVIGLQLERRFVPLTKMPWPPWENSTSAITRSPALS
jgi:hypothetical protein